MVLPHRNNMSSVRSLRSNRVRLWLLIAWSLFLSLVSFYGGVVVGMTYFAVSVPLDAAAAAASSPLSNNDNNKKEQRPTKLLMEKDVQITSLKHKVSDLELVLKSQRELKQPFHSTSSTQQRRFPKTTEAYMHGVALVEKFSFLDRFDVGIARNLFAEVNNQHVLILYQHKNSVPNNMPSVTHIDVAAVNTELPILTVDEATQNCDSLNIVSSKPHAGLKQCTAFVGQYESAHLHRYMRTYENVGLNSSIPLQRVSRMLQHNGAQMAAPPPSKTQERNWNQLLMYLGMIPHLKKSLKPILESMTGAPIMYTATYDKPRPGVIVMACNLGQADLLVNFVCTARAKELDLSRVLVFCADVETSQLANALGLQGFYDKDLFQTIPSEEADTYGDTTFGAIMFVKVVSVHLVNLLGYDVLFQDVDIVWDRNPLPYFKTHYKDFDIIFQDDGARSVRFAPYSGNSGFYYVRHNPRTKYLLTNTVYIGDQLMRYNSHQLALTITMSEHSSLFGLRVKTMTHNDLFLGGFHFHRDFEKMRQIINGKVTWMIFHMCWTQNRDNKIKFMQQMGMFQLEDKCTTGPKAYDVYSKTGDTGFLQACCAAEPKVECHFSDKPAILDCSQSPKIDEKGKIFASVK